MANSVLIVCLGTRGDVQPFVALGVGLQSRGVSRVRIATSLDFEPFVTSHGLGYARLTQSMNDALNTPAGRALKRAGPLSAGKLAKQVMTGLASVLASDVLAAVRAERPDCVLLATIPEQVGLHRIAMHFGIPWAALHTVPFRPTRELAPPTAGLGMSAPFRWLNGFIWRLSMQMVHKLMIGPCEAQVMEVLKDIPPTPPPGGVAAQGAKPRLAAGFADASAAYIYSSALLPQPTDWDAAKDRTVGYLPLADGASYTPPAALASFLAAQERVGRPVIYIGLGSMLSVMFDGDTSRIRPVVDKLLQGALAVTTANGKGKATAGTAAAAPRAAVLLHTVVGASHVLPTAAVDPDRDGVLLLTEPVPHDWLLPHCAAAVYHGGAGTTQAVLAAGKPALVLPCGPTSDQPFWADVLQRRRLGLKGPLIDKLTSSKLAALLHTLLTRLPALTAATTAAAAAMAKEDSVGAVLALLRDVTAPAT